MSWPGGQAPHEDSAVVPRSLTGDGGDFRTLNGERKEEHKMRRSKYRTLGDRTLQTCHVVLLVSLHKLSPLRMPFAPCPNS